MKREGREMTDDVTRCERSKEGTNQIRLMSFGLCVRQVIACHVM